MKRRAVLQLILLFYSATVMASGVSNPTLPPLTSLGMNMSITFPNLLYTTTTVESTTFPEGQSTTVTSITTKLTTTTLYCPSDTKVCYVEYDMTGDGKFECCDEKNNQMCETCFETCKIICQNRREGVKYCFGSNITYSCECTRGVKPTCYQTTTTRASTTTTTYASVVEAAKANKTLFYLMLMVITLAVLVGLIVYVRNL